MVYPRRRRSGWLMVARGVTIVGVVTLLGVFSGGHHSNKRQTDDPSQTANSDLTGSDGSPPDGERTLRHLLSIMRITNVTKLSNGSEEIEEICTRPAFEEFPPDAFTNAERRQGALVLHVMLAVYMFAALAVVCDLYFVSSLDKICEKLHLSEDVAGATFMAAGSSAPELFTSVIGVFIAKGDVGVGTIVGSAVFNILFVIGLCGILAGQIVMLTWYPLIRDSTFYSMSVIILISSIADGAVEWYEAMLMLLLYVAYIGVMWFNTPLQKWAVARIHIFGVRPDDVKQILSPSDDRKCYQTYEMFPQENGTKPGEQTPDVFSSHETRRVSFEDACFRIMKGKEFKSKTRFKSAAYIILLERREMTQRRRRQKTRPKTFSLDSDSTSYMKAVRGSTAIQDEFDSAADWKQLPLFDDGICHIFRWVALLPIKIVLYYTVPNCREPRWQGWFMVTFINSIVWIAIFSYLMVWMVAVIGFTFGIPDSIMGITFLAAGTSVPDAMASVMVARQGQGDMAVSNTIGSNVFDILIGLALPWFIQTALVSAGSTVAINSNGLVFSVVLLFLTVILTISAVHFGGWRLDRRLGIICLLSYSVFLFFSIMIEFNVFGYVNAPMCVESG